MAFFSCCTAADTEAVVTEVKLDPVSDEKQEVIEAPVQADAELAPVAAPVQEAPPTVAEDPPYQAEPEPAPVAVPVQEAPPKVEPEPEVVASKAAAVFIQPSAQVTAQIPKGKRKMAIDVNHCDVKTFLVTKVNLGPIQEWNVANLDKELAPGDQITVVNGASGEKEKMLEACKLDSLDLTFTRCEEKTISFVSGADLGISLLRVCDMSLVISGVEPDGLVAQHNSEELEHPPDSEDRHRGTVDIEDRILAVNGIRGKSDEMYNEIRKAQPVELKVRRIWPVFKETRWSLRSAGEES